MFLATLIVLLFFKLISFLKVHNDILWMSQLAVSELGHLLSIFLIFSGMAYYLLYKRERWSKWICAFALGLSVFYFLPLLQAFVLQFDIQKQMARNFSRSGVTELGIDPQKLLNIDSSELEYFAKEGIAPEEKVYWQNAGQQLKILNYHSEEYRVKEAPASWVLVVHGGGWDAGYPAQLSSLNYELEKHGFAVFALEYRLAPQHKWPAPLEDVFNAVNWIKKNATSLDVNPSNGFILGRSAGGQIALSACYSGKIKELKGCVAFYAPTDMKVAYEVSSPGDFFRPIPRIRAIMGGTPEEVPEVYAAASPLQFVTSQSVPTLLLHGSPDFWVWVGHSRSLYRKLQEKGVRSVYIEIPWANHGFDFNLNGPAGQLSTNAILSFLVSEDVK